MHRPGIKTISCKVGAGLTAVGWVLSGACAFGVSFSFTNSGLIAINDNYSYPGTPATSYPSTNIVNGLTGMVATKATVTLHGFSHAFPSDVSILLVGPHGQEAILMSETGGASNLSVTNLTLTLDDDATSHLPYYTTLQPGTFKPTNGYLVHGYTNLHYDFPIPAPPGNSNAPATLSVFQNSDPDGAWRLFVLDESHNCCAR